MEEIPFSELVSQINLRWARTTRQSTSLSVDVPLVSSYGYRGWLLTPLNDIFSEEELADFLPAALAAGTYNGDLLAAPVSTSTQLLYYNADALEAAGITPPGPDDRWTWEQVADVAQQVQSGDGDQVDVWGFQWEQTTAPYQLLPLMGSLGGEYIGEDGISVDGVVNSEEWIEAATFYYDMFNTYGVSPQGDAMNGPGSLRQRQSGHVGRRSMADQRFRGKCRLRTGASPVIRTSTAMTSPPQPAAGILA